MPVALINQLHEVGSTCRELAAWCRCEGGRKDLCEKCILGGPEICDAKVIKALVGVVVVSRHETDQVEVQKEYWRGIVTVWAASVGMNLDRVRDSTPE